MTNLYEVKMKSAGGAKLELSMLSSSASKAETSCKKAYTAYTVKSVKLIQKDY